MTVCHWNIQRKLYEVEWQNLFGNWCIVRKLKQRWNHGERTTQNWSSQHYTWRKFCCRNFSFWQKIFKNIDCYRMVLEWSKKIVWSRVADFFLHWCLDRERKQRWNHGVMATKNLPSLHYTYRKYRCRHFSFLQEILKNIDRYLMVLEYSKKIVWRRVAEIFLEVGILTENQSKDEIVWLQNGIIFT